MKFNIGDQAKYIGTGFPNLTGVHGRIVSTDNIANFVGLKHGENSYIHAHENVFKLVDDTVSYKEGDILTNEDEDIKILGICGSVYLMSCSDDHDAYDCGYTRAELDNNGWTLKESGK